jgi:Flp pilus assembly pilin Flp
MFQQLASSLRAFLKNEDGPTTVGTGLRLNLMAFLS